MAIMKKGTKTALKSFDTFATLCVGDVVREAGSTMDCTINKYGKVVDKYGIEHATTRLHLVKAYEGPVESERPNDFPAFEGKKSEAASLETEVHPESEKADGGNCRALTDYTPQELVDELRARGWEVTCSRTEMKPVTVNL